ncbi:nickel pincer cofactor biosynthesis protein LarC [Thermodesulfobacteriota bacterium]
MTIAYLDCFAGISGDMFLGALLDAGLSPEELRKALLTLPLEGFSIEIRKEQRNHLAGTRFIVHVEQKKQHRRGLKEVKKIIEESAFSQVVKDGGLKIFDSLALVESRAHHCAPEDVHFHEIGAVDSIIDILGTLYGVEALGVSELFCSALPVGSGFVETSHGRLPVPAPATLTLLEGVPIYDSGLKYELVTPTGAALLKGLVKIFGPMPTMTVRGSGYGVGSRELHDRPNLLRLVLGDQQHEQQCETVVILEANLDNTNPEWLGFLMERLFESGALDAVFFPVQMKKNRPGILVQVMGRPWQRDALMDILFRESTTLGVRFRYSQRKILKRSIVEVDSPWGKLKVKKVFGPDGSPFFMPEYEACRKIAEKNGLPIKDIYYWVMSLNQK